MLTLHLRTANIQLLSACLYSDSWVLSVFGRLLLITCGLRSFDQNVLCSHSLHKGKKSLRFRLVETIFKLPPSLPPFVFKPPKMSDSSSIFFSIFKGKIANYWDFEGILTWPPPCYAINPPPQKPHM